VALDVRASIACATDTAPLSPAALAAANSTTDTKTAWDVRPWTLGFPTDESPDLTSLILPLVAADVRPLLALTSLPYTYRASCAPHAHSTLLAMLTLLTLLPRWATAPSSYPYPYPNPY